MVCVLQMPVYGEITRIEPKVLLGLSWRTLAACAVMGVVGGGVWLLLCGGALGLPFGGRVSTDLAMPVVSLVVAPAALWGWWRPKGLKPERYLVYVARHAMSPARLFMDGPARPVRAKRKPSVRERRR